MGKPDQKDLNENMAATQGLSHMITDCKKLFQVGVSRRVHSLQQGSATVHAAPGVVRGQRSNDGGRTAHRLQDVSPRRLCLSFPPPLFNKLLLAL